MKKILLLAVDPGGANTIIPLVGRLREKGYKVLVFGKDNALDKFKQNHIRSTDILKHIKSINMKSAKLFLEKEKPCFIITGTSANDMTEKYLWKSSEAMGIPSFAILDQWVNYGIRFSKFGLNEIEKYLRDKKFEYIPTKILVMDTLAKKEMVLEGVSGDRIIITGQPYFEQLREKKFNTEEIEKIKRNFSIQKNDFTVIFASEPISKTYKQNYWGCNEISIFIALYKTLIKIKNKQINLIVRLHPKEDMDYYDKLSSKISNSKNLKFYFDQKTNAWDLIKSANLVCGMSSIFLFESVLLNKPTLSIMIGLNKENPFILDKIGVLKSIRNEDRLFNEINKIINGKNRATADLKIIKDPVKRIIEQMERLLCRN